MFSYPILGQLEKAGADQASYRVNFAQGILAGLTVGTFAATALDSSGASATSLIVNTMSVSGNIATVKLKAGGASGAPAADGTRFRVRTAITLSDSRELIHDTFIYCVAPAYLPV